jgi:hypothetical protein
MARQVGHFIGASSTCSHEFASEKEPPCLASRKITGRKEAASRSIDASWGNEFNLGGIELEAGRGLEDCC